MIRTLPRICLPLISALALSGCVTHADRQLHMLPVHAQYVAMGSSFAAGPGIMPMADQPANRCSRSRDNYARQLARMLELDLIDVSCGGATTGHILGPWSELPPQIEAVTPATRLVTITIGGNDVGYIGHLLMSSCRLPATGDTSTLSPFCKGMLARRSGADAQARSRAFGTPDSGKWQAVESNLRRIVTEIRTRAPQARIIFVDYVTLLPEGKLCAEVPLSPEDAAQSRATAATLAAITARVAKETRTGLIEASRLSRGHDVCAAKPWITGLTVRPGQPASATYHPNISGMKAIAAALRRYLQD